MNTDVKANFRITLVALMLLAAIPACRAQVNDNPPVVPRWSGPAPVQFCIDPSMEV